MMSDSSSPNNADEAERRFRQLPADLQERILHDGGALGLRVRDHVVQLLIGVPGGETPASDASHASGVLVFARNRLCLFTAQHVLKGYRKRKQLDNRVVFQAGNISFDPEPRIIYESPDYDLLALGMNNSDQGRIEAHVWRAATWQPPTPSTGDFVAFAGLPSGYRVNDGATVEFAIVGGILQVVSADGGTFKVHMNRETVIKVVGPHVLPAGTELGGMSGGPVFRLAGGDLELYGIITDFGPQLDLFIMSPLMHATDAVAAWHSRFSSV